MPRIEVVGGQDVFVTVEFEKPYYERLQMASIIRAKDEAEYMGLFPCSHFRIKVQWLRTDRVWGQKVWAIRGFRTKILNLTWLFKNKLHATSDIHTLEKKREREGEGHCDLTYINWRSENGSLRYAFQFLGNLTSSKIRKQIST